MRCTPVRLAGLLSLTLAASAAAQNGTSATADGAPPGIYTEAQATKGEAAFAKHCGECHSPAAHTGAGFMELWDGRTAFDLFDQIRSTMPNDKPGKLGRGQYAEIVAYLLQLNGLPAGDKPLPSKDEQLQQIVIQAPPSPPQE